MRTPIQQVTPPSARPRLRGWLLSQRAAIFIIVKKRMISGANATSQAKTVPAPGVSPATGPKTLIKEPQGIRVVGRFHPQTIQESKAPPISTPHGIEPVLFLGEECVPRWPMQPVREKK
jgi:hypothetical protein